MSFLYSLHTHGKPIHWDTDFDKDLDRNIKLRINVEREVYYENLEN